MLEPGDRLLRSELLSEEGSDLDSTIFAEFYHNKAVFVCAEDPCTAFSVSGNDVRMGVAEPVIAPRRRHRDSRVNGVYEPGGARRARSVMGYLEQDRPNVSMVEEPVFSDQLDVRGE